MTFDLTATQYVRDWVLAQFYFHVMKTYAILRANGVPLGKGDYVAHLLPFLPARTRRDGLTRGIFPRAPNPDKGRR